MIISFYITNLFKTFFAFSELLRMFVVHIKFKLYEIYTSDIKRTKKQGRRTGESPDFLSKSHDLDLVCSDRPALFNQIFKIMHTNKKEFTGHEALKLLQQFDEKHNLSTALLHLDYARERYLIYSDYSEPDEKIMVSRSVRQIMQLPDSRTLETLTPARAAQIFTEIDSKIGFISIRDDFQTLLDEFLAYDIKTEPETKAEVYKAVKATTELIQSILEYQHDFKL
jgi:hypothetical protein